MTTTFNPGDRVVIHQGAYTRPDPVTVIERPERHAAAGIERAVFADLGADGVCALDPDDLRLKSRALSPKQSHALVMKMLHAGERKAAERGKTYRSSIRWHQPTRQYILIEGD